ncbi:PREDICTED: cadherin EGF LAG seven-pass G-type receptor 3-like [Rhinopithecus bieti]|uniref:cadherin EGF LAG seven-pass G-type receptor 3-like n=1 Tax=Rhinopithecus bieti TaxID=61621 RepID=UPI00083C1F19|nr:PREDICTED: cadherin EGF LAG seven-pass G-type receptor 3-like [Rhinopithecus bieti]
MVSLDFSLFQDTMAVGSELQGLKVKQLHVGGLPPGSAEEDPQGLVGCIQPPSECGAWLCHDQRLCLWALPTSRRLPGPLADLFLHLPARLLWPRLCGCLPPEPLSEPGIMPAPPRSSPRLYL